MRGRMKGSSSNGMKIRIGIVALVLAATPAHLWGSFEGSDHGARSQAMGGTFVSLGDDASALFLNGAGLVTLGTAAFYGDYAEPPREDVTTSAKGCVAVPAWGVVAAAGWYRLERTDGNTENLFTAGIARKLLEGTQGSFLAVSAGLSVGRILSDPACSLCGGRSSESAVGGDIGVMLRPLPILSLGYAVTNVGGAGFARGGTDWPRVHRWGVSYFWQQRVVVSFGQEHAGGNVRRRYGFSVRTALPAELMGGFSEGNVSGGVRVQIDRFRAAAAFSSSERYGPAYRVSLEILVGRVGGEYER